MKYIIGEVLSGAIMTKTPVIIVEGIDDVKVYDDVCGLLDSDYQVLPIECIKDFSEGNEHVISAMEHILNMPSSKYDYGKYILGIIDKDVRDYRGELPNNRLICTLKYYSMESHFINKIVIKEMLHMFTKITSDLLVDELVDVIYDNISLKLHDIYLLSLEALKGAVDRSYHSEFCYSFSEGRVTNQTDIDRVRNKKDSLLSFADDMNIEYSMDSIKRIAKGKWLFYLFSYLLEKEMISLPSMCHEHKITSCRICMADVDKCLYRIKDGVTHKVLRSASLGVIESSDFIYIKERIGTMVV